MYKINDKLYNWASIIDPNAIVQAERTSRLPFVDRVALMPDAHVGMGATVGSVIGTSGAIIPAAVGVDIGCGMAAVHFDMTASDLPEDMDKFMPFVERAIPAGVGQGHAYTSKTADAWLQKNKDSFSTVLDQRLTGKALEQFGTLGSGNHFFEVCLDENDEVWIVLHSGSRGLGNILGMQHINKAKKLAVEKGRGLEDKDLAYFMDTDDGFNLYISDMLACQNWAAANREMMLENSLKGFFAFLGRGFGIKEKINCHHNFTQKEYQCFTCTDIQHSERLEHERRKDEQLSTVQDFLSDCQIGSHSCGGLVLSFSRDGQVIPPLLAGALVRSLCDLPEGDQVSLVGCILEPRSVHLCSCHRSQTSTPTFDRNLGSMSSHIVPRLLSELEKVSHIRDIEPVWSFLGTVSLSSHNYNTNCGGTDPSHHGSSLWITRKGAIKAATGDLGIIPGSMGARSYIVEGLGNADSFCSCSHGAGRVYSRSAAKQLFSVDDLNERMKGKAWNDDKALSLVDEIPDAYKPIEQVMKDQADLVKIKYELSQVFNFKGC